MSLRTAIIRPCAKKDIDPGRPLSEQKTCLYSKKDPEKLLGRHPDEESAKKQEAAIQISKHASSTDEDAYTANFKALQVYLLYEVAKHIIDYAKGKRLQKPAEQVWNELFSKSFKITTRGPLKRGQDGGQYKIEGSLLFVNGDTKRPIKLLIVAAYWKMKPTILLQLTDKNARKPFFSILDKDLLKIVKRSKDFISKNLIFPPIKAGDKVSIRVIPHKGRLGLVQSYQSFAKRVLVRLEPRKNIQDEQPIDVWFDRDQVTLMTMNEITRQFQAAIDVLEPLHPDLANRIAKAKEQYKAKTDLEKMIGEMVQGQSGIWLDKKQMAILVLELHKQNIKEPKDGAYDEIAQAVGKLLDKLIPDAGDKKKEKTKKEKKSSEKVSQVLSEKYGFSTDADLPSIRLDYSDNICVKQGNLVLGEDEIIIPGYLKSGISEKSVDIDITVVQPREGQPFDVLFVPAFGDRPECAVVDTYNNKFILTPTTAEGIAASIYAASEQPSVIEKIGIKVEVEVEIDLGDLLGLGEEFEEEEMDEEEDDAILEGPRPITETELSQYAVMPSEQAEEAVPSEPMVLDPDDLKTAPMGTPAPTQGTDPRFPPVPFRWQ